MYQQNTNFNPTGLNTNDPQLAKAKGKQVRKGNSPQAQDTGVNPFNEFDSAATGRAPGNYGSQQNFSAVSSGAKPPITKGPIKQPYGIDVDKSKPKPLESLTNYKRKSELY